MKTQSMVKEYTVTVGINYPYIGGEDTFEIKLTMSDDDIKKLVEEDLKFIWVSNSIDSWEYIEAFLPEVYQKGVALAEEYCVPIWGEQMKVANGAQYEFFLPDEVEEAISNDVKHIKERRLRKKLQEESRKKAHEEYDVLMDEYRKGRLKDRLRPDPQSNNAVFTGLWSGSGQYHDRAGDYWFEASIISNGHDIVVNYFKKYMRNETELEIGIKYGSLSCVENACRELGYEEYQTNGNYLKTLSKGGNSDIEFFMRVIDKIIETT